jgi:hypothetical protein
MLLPLTSSLLAAVVSIPTSQQPQQQQMVPPTGSLLAAMPGLTIYTIAGPAAAAAAGGNSQQQQQQREAIHRASTPQPQQPAPWQCRGSDMSGGGGQGSDLRRYSTGTMPAAGPGGQSAHGNISSNRQGQSLDWHGPSSGSMLPPASASQGQTAPPAQHTLPTLVYTMSEPAPAQQAPLFIVEGRGPGFNPGPPPVGHMPPMGQPGGPPPYPPAGQQGRAGMGQVLTLDHLFAGSPPAQHGWLGPGFGGPPQGPGAPWASGPPPPWASGPPPPWANGPATGPGMLMVDLRGQPPHLPPGGYGMMPPSGPQYMAQGPPPGPQGPPPPRGWW